MEAKRTYNFLPAGLILWPEDGGSRVLRNVGDDQGHTWGDDDFYDSVVGPSVLSRTAAKPFTKLLQFLQKLLMV
jgi:hypothetical protein